VDECEIIHILEHHHCLVAHPVMSDHLTIKAVSCDVHCLVVYSKSIEKLWRHSDACSAAVDGYSYSRHVSVMISYLDFVYNVR